MYNDDVLSYNFLLGIENRKLLGRPVLEFSLYRFSVQIL